MFNLSTQDVVLSIEKSPLKKINGTIYQEYKDFFGKKFTLPTLENKNFIKLEFQEDRPRIRLDYNDELMKTIKVFFMNTAITSALENKFNTELQFSSADVWVDNAGYKLEPHVDDDRIKLSVQIYLSDNNKGTSLYDKEGNVQYTFPFKCNYGYALYNGPHSDHGVEEVKDDGRTSLYVRYQ
jgi:hypothetical protein